VTWTREPISHSHPIVSKNGVPYTVAIKQQEMKTTPGDEDRGTTRLSRNESHYISQLVHDDRHYRNGEDRGTTRLSRDERHYILQLVCDNRHYRNVVPCTVAMKQCY